MPNLNYHEFYDRYVMLFLPGISRQAMVVKWSRSCLRILAAMETNPRTNLAIRCVSCQGYARPMTASKLKLASPSESGDGMGWFSFSLHQTSL
jgi:hypothetical protein